MADLLARSHEAGLAWDAATGMFVDRWGSFCPFVLAPQELEARLVESWQRTVAVQVARRKGSEGMEMVDFHLTKCLLYEFGREDQALLRVSLNGTFFTEDALFHTGEADLPQCPCCGCKDSAYHRVWECAALEDV